jgi:hypothetical protein
MEIATCIGVDFATYFCAMNCEGAAAKAGG